MRRFYHKLFRAFLRRKQDLSPGRRSPFRILAGLVCSSAVGWLAYQRKSLSRGGVVGAAITGTTTVGLGGWHWGLTLIFFFASSSLLSHWRAQEKERTAGDKFSKGGQRDLGQVMANGGVATLLALAYGLSNHCSFRRTLQAGYIGALGAATADTWATELGVLSRQQPRLITTGEPTMPGTSGGITALGTGTAALGALALGSCFWLLTGASRQYRSFPLLALLSGLAGSFFDSFLGATIQAMYYCPNCAKETERKIHSCGTPTRPLRGLPWMNNDVVNFLATLLGSLTAVAIHLPAILGETRHRVEH